MIWVKFGFTHAVAGFVKAVALERNLKIHLIFAIVVISLGFIFQLSAIEWCIIVGCIVGVIAFELMNTAVEKLVDLVSPEFNPKAGLIKDIAASAVLLFTIASAIIGLIIFIPKIMH